MISLQLMDHPNRSLATEKTHSTNTFQKKTRCPQNISGFSKVSGATCDPHSNLCWSRSGTEAIQGNKVRTSWTVVGGVTRSPFIWRGASLDHVEREALRYLSFVLNENNAPVNHRTADPRGNPTDISMGYMYGIFYLHEWLMFRYL